MFEAIIVITNVILLLGVLYFIWDTKKKDRTQETQIINDVLSSIKGGNEKLYETIEKIQIKHAETLEKIQVKYFDSLEKNLQKSNILLDKQNKEFLKVFAQVFKKDIKLEVPKVLEADSVENSIENASEPEEIMLSDTPRIPIVEGVNIKFEDENESMPININPMETYQDKSENPIEK